MTKNSPDEKSNPSDAKPDFASRRRFVRQCVIGASGLALGTYAARDFLSGDVESGFRSGFRNDAPGELWQWAKEASYYEKTGYGPSVKIECLLCPHKCILGERDRGFCRSRVVLNGKLHTLVYGNPCAVHLDPIEKKPLNHFLPGTTVLSVAAAGCNLRCLNCQNWEISQARPKEAAFTNLPPKQLVAEADTRSIPSIAYTYSEPITFYEYALDSARLAHRRGIRNVLVTAGYILPEPLRGLCRFSDAANVDIKGFNEPFYKQVTRGTLLPILEALEIMKREGVWIEITRLVVPTLSDQIDDIRRMADWIAENLGRGTPLHISRFHPAHKLRSLPPTPLDTLERAREAARRSGLDFVYVGNTPEKQVQDTICPKCHNAVIKRRGYRILFDRLKDGRCPCGESIPGVWS